MKSQLLYPDADLDMDGDLPYESEDVAQDLELTTLWSVMAGGDKLLYAVCRRVLLLSVTEPEVVRYRQAALKDCLAHPDVVTALYRIAVEAIEAERHAYFGLYRRSPTTVLSRSTTVLELFRHSFQELRTLVDRQTGGFESPCFTQFFTMISKELDDEYLALVDQRLDELRFRRGMVISARIGHGMQGVDHTLRDVEVQHWWHRLTGERKDSYSFEIPERDESGFQALNSFEGQGVTSAADALGRSADHVLSFFVRLRDELAFYLGCLNLHRALAEHHRSVCWPTPRPAGDATLTAHGLYDTCLSLRVDGPVVPNDIRADGADLVIITGANQGGKSTFVRALGQAQLMLQAGMFVAADTFEADLRTGVFTHFKREEDASMESGKLDEEMARMSGIVTALRTHGLVVCNESFAATNEREGSQIAREILMALRDAHVMVYFVTHMFDLADSMYRDGGDSTVFLRADRGDEEGHRTYKITPGRPLPTSFGQDTFARVFG